MVSNVLERAREEGEETWDDDFAEGISFSKFGMSPSSFAFFFSLPHSRFLEVIIVVLLFPYCDEKI